MRYYLLKVPVDNISLDEVVSRLQAGKRFLNIFVNIHKIVLFHKAPELNSVIFSEDVLFSVDGRWIQIIGMLKGFPLKHRFGGLDVIYKICDYAQHGNLGIYLLGGEKQIIERVSTKLKEKFPELNIVGVQDGFSLSDIQIINEIKRKTPDIIFIALPSPKKELLGYQILHEVTSVKYIAGVGGAFDIIAERFKRAPKFIQWIAMEWLWRSMNNKQLFVRYIRDFIYLLRIVFSHSLRF